jgi:hypothetical protein
MTEDGIERLRAALAHAHDKKTSSFRKLLEWLGVMRSPSLVALMFILLTCSAWAQHCRKADTDPSTGSCTVPDPALTPGLMDSSLVCVSNQDRPCNVTLAEKKAILKAYGYPASTDMSTGEFDHWFPHWMGGSDTQENIWFELHAGKFGSLAKDKVELLLWRKVCVSKTMTLTQAKKAYLKGWTRLLPQ